MNKCKCKKEQKNNKESMMGARMCNYNNNSGMFHFDVFFGFSGGLYTVGGHRVWKDNC